MRAAPPRFPRPGASTRASSAGTPAARRPRLLRNKPLVTGGAIMAFVLLITLLAPLAAPYDPTAVNVPERLGPPTPAHPMGTDDFGRDVLSRVLAGGLIALVVGGVSVGIALAAGVPVGLLAGYWGGWPAEVVMRVMDGLLAFPTLLLAIAVVAVLGPGHIQAMIAIGVVLVPVFARLVRGQVLSLREREFVLAARALGATDAAIVWRHVLPNVMSVVIVQATVSFAGAILAEAALSYLGMGTQPPIPSWGAMLQQARGHMMAAPWTAIFPGLAIAVTVFGVNLLGDGMRDLLDPRFIQGV